MGQSFRGFVVSACLRGFGGTGRSSIAVVQPEPCGTLGRAAALRASASRSSDGASALRGPNPRLGPNLSARRKAGSLLWAALTSSRPEGLARQSPGASAASAAFRVPGMAEGEARRAAATARPARSRSRGGEALSPNRARQRGAVKTKAAPIAKSAGMKTKPAHPLQAAGPIARAATPASAMRSVDAAFSGG